MGSDMGGDKGSTKKSPARELEIRACMGSHMGYCKESGMGAGKKFELGAGTGVLS